MLFSYLLSLFAVGSVFAGRHHSYSSSSLDSSVVCARELEGVVYVPKNCAYNYLKSINKVLKVQSPLFWTSPVQAKSIVDSFKATYGVIVVFIDAMGRIHNYPLDSTIIPGSDNGNSIAYARSCALGEGFSASAVYPAFPNDLVATYMSVYWNPDGEMYTVGILMPKSKLLDYC